MAGSLAELITDEKPSELLSQLKESLVKAFEDAEQFKTAFLVRTLVHCDKGRLLAVCWGAGERCPRLITN